MNPQDHAWRRWICVLARSCAKHTSLTASFTNGFAVGAGLPCVSLRSEVVDI
jgi:hypothetical protein